MISETFQSTATAGRINQKCLLRRNVRTQPYGRCTVCTLKLAHCHAWQSNGIGFALVVALLSLLLVPPGWPQMLLVALLLGVVVWQGMVNHRRTDELIYGQYRLSELTRELRTKQVIIEQQNSNLAAQVEKRTAELREANLQLAAANLELLEIDSQRTALLSNISHELRTPLTGILGSAQNLRDGLAGDLTNEQREYVAMIESHSGRLIRVVNELLDWGRLEAGRIQLNRKPVAVQALIDDVALLLRPAADHKAIVLELPRTDAVAWVDADKLRQVLINLLDNAIKFSGPRSRVQLGITNTGTELRFTVQDQGPGIDAADASHLFERFYRGPTADGTTGTGLGLAIARNLARLHGGDVTLNSVTGQGSLFTLSLPVATAGTTP